MIAPLSRALGVAVFVAAAALTAQERPAGTGQALLLEIELGGDGPDSAVVTLERRVVYWIHVQGRGTPSVRPALPRAPGAVIVGVEDGFEINPLHAGPHIIRLAGLPAGTSATLRLYVDGGLTRRMADKWDRLIRVGAQLTGGWHTGYRIDPLGGANPGSGGELDACLVIETGSRLTSCLGGGRSWFPEGDLVANWIFIEERGRLFSGTPLGDRRLDLGLTVRLSHDVEVGPRRHSPLLLGVGVYAAQRLAREGRSRGWQLIAAWQRGRLFSAPETELLDTNRFTLGLVWLP